MTRSSKGFAHILLLFIIFGILLVLAFFSLNGESNNSFHSKNTESTSSYELSTDDQSESLNTDQINDEPEEKYLKEWDSYTSERFDISFNNPGNFFLVTTYEDHYPDQGHIQIIEMKNWEYVTGPPQGRAGPPVIGISVYENPENLALLEWAKKRSSHSNYKDYHVETTVDGKKAIRYKWEGMGQGETVLVLDSNSGNIVSIHMFVTEDLTKPFEDVLNSFEFTQ